MSRLIKKERTKSFYLAVFFGFLTLLLSLGLIFVGIPLLIKMAVILSNLRSPPSFISETTDTLPPSPPRLIALPEATNSAQIKVEGFSEPDATIKLFVNNTWKETTTDKKDGYFLFKQIKLKEGKNEIFAVAQDQAGNKSQPSPKIMIDYDSLPPQLEIFSPPDQTQVEKKEINIEGQTEPEASVTINDHMVILDVEGRFNYSLSLEEGENIIKIVARDRAGNQSEKQLTVTYTP